MDTPHTIEEYEIALAKAKEEVHTKTRILESTLSTVSFLYRISSALAAAKNTEALFSIFIEEVGRFLNTEIALVLTRINPGNYHALATHGVSAEEAKLLNAGTRNPAAEHVWGTKKIEVKHSSEATTLVLPDPLQRYPIKVLLSAPVQTSDGVAAIIQFFRISGDIFSLEDERIVRILLDRLSSTLNILSAQEELAKKGIEHEQVIKELEENKRAILNLLEDTRLVEQKEKEQAEELRKAVNEIQHFANVADQERATYLLLLSSIGEGVLVLDLDRKILILNAAGEEILGFTKDELVNRRFEDVLHFTNKDGGEIPVEDWEGALTGDTPKVFSSNLFVEHKSGKRTPLAIIVSPIIDAQRHILKGVIITFRDIEAENALDEARISFISIASHQLRTPLTSMRWFAEMLLSGDAGEVNEDQKHFVERIYDGTDRMINLVNLLLQIARVEAGRIKIEPVPTDLRAITQAVMLTLHTSLQEKSQTVTITTNPDPLPLIAMEQDYVWQIIQNFLTNAIRYSPEQSTITVSITQKSDHMEYAVSDRGIGIPKSEQSKIFQKFFRAENAVKSVPEGSGLGLSLVKSLVEGWGGEVWFESEEGVGTTFFMTIPLSGMQARKGDVKLSVD